MYKVHHGPVLSLLVFAIPADKIPEYAREDLMNEILYAGDLVLMSEKENKSFKKGKRGV